MDVTISLNGGALVRSQGFMGSRFLCEAFVKRGHNLRAINPEDIYNESCNEKGCFYSRRTFSYDSSNDSFFESERDFKLSGDVFFVYGLGEDSSNPVISQKFMNQLFDLEAYYDYVLNSANATSYENKLKQQSFLKREGFPVIPSFDVGSFLDLECLIISEGGVIAKPHVGFLGKGVLYAGSSADLPIDFDFGNYVFQKFVPATEERRYLFLDNNLLLQRRVQRSGPFGREVYGGVDLIEGPKRERDLARRIMDSVGMFYGSVDFRGEGQSYVLEVNGSGTGVAPPDDGDLRDCYNLSGPIVKAVERKLEGSV
jgi:glutathione synthase/RimK-type ligase-like ATP-grasp enzyme